MSRLESKRVLLGVGGGIAAYKAPEVVRAFRKAGAEVRVVLTRAAEEFVSPLALEVVSENRVGKDLFDPTFEHEIGHIELARWADVVVVAPATANLLARMRVGMADDLLTTIALATTAPVVVAPAMNTQMWMHPAVRENLDVLVSRGVFVVAPDAGELACKEVGPGRMPDPDVLVEAAERALPGGLLVGLSLCVSAGPTREYFDPVRFLSNPSSGRMGYAIATAARAHGADVTLISGPTGLATPRGVKRIDVVSAGDMAGAVQRECASDVLIMCAAVADWRPRDVAPEKRKKTEGVWTPELERTEDILLEASRSAARPKVVVGFAAETSNVEENARAKLVAKALDGVVANAVGGEQGFGSEDNQVLLIARDGSSRAVGPAPKREVADEIVAWVAAMLRDGT